MKLNDYIKKKLVEYNLNHDADDLEKYITNQAREMAKGEQSIGIDNEQIDEWIRTYVPDAKVKKVVATKPEPKREEKQETKEVEKVGTIKGSTWEQNSLF